MESRKLIESFEFYVYAITELRKNGATSQQIADELGVTRGQVLYFLKECKEKGAEIKREGLLLECQSKVSKDCLKYVKRVSIPKGRVTCISCKMEEQRIKNKQYKNDNKNPTRQE